MQNLVRSSAQPRSWRCGRIILTDRGGMLQTGSGKFPFDGVFNGRFQHASSYVHSCSRTTLGSGPLWICKRCECSFARSMDLKAQDFCGTHACQSVSLSQLPAMSTFTFWWRMPVCLDHAEKRFVQAPFLRSRCSYSNAFNPGGKPMDALKTVEKIWENGCDYAAAPDNAHNPPCIPTLKKSLLPIDDLADMLVSAATDPDSMDIKQIQFQLVIRFRRTPSETFLSDLQIKLATLQLPLPILKPLLKKRSFVFTSPEHLQAMLKVLKVFFYSGKTARSILARNPSILEKSLEHLQQILNVIVEFQIEKQTVEKNTGILKLDIDRSRDVLGYLNSWGVDAASRNKMLRRELQFMRCSLKEKIQPVLNFLESTGMSKSEILALLEGHPEILSRQVVNNLMPKYNLCQKLGLKFSTAVGYIKYHAYGRILSQFEFLKKQGLSDDDIIQLVKREPRVLGKSRESLKMKLDFLLHTHNRDISEIVKFPACLCYSFRGRILPRVTFLKKVALFDSLSLGYILAMKTPQFRRVFKVPESVKL